MIFYYSSACVQVVDKTIVNQLWIQSNTYRNKVSKLTCKFCANTALNKA